MNLIFHHPGFQNEVRTRLDIWDRPVSDMDVLRVTKLDLSDFSFLPEDRDVLCCFQNLTSLSIEIYAQAPQFWHNFPDLAELYLCSWGNAVDFESFRHMQKLETLCVSGGNLSGIDYLHLEALTGLNNLRFLELHEFGSVDISPLQNMKQLKTLALRYANQVIHMEAIGKMYFLDELILDGLQVKQLDFLDSLPDTLSLQMYGIHVREGVDLKKWDRFIRLDLDEISTGNTIFDFLD